jgi:prepilin-type N-terminal cleavage/methylation domain-containing protein
MKKNGFTLIELLAIIVVLAIIMVIAVPQILNTITSAKKGALESNAKLVLDALDNQKLANENFDATTINQDNLSDIGLSNDNYTTLKIGLYQDKPYIVIVGKNKWAGLKACGNMKNMEIVNASDTTTCANLPVTISSMHPKTINSTCNPEDLVDSCLGEITLLPYSFTPVGYLKCNGSLVSTASYPDLYSLIGTTFGGDGSSTFGIPDLTASVPQVGLNYFIAAGGNTPNWTSTAPITNGDYNYFSYQSIFKNYLVGEIRLALATSAAGNTMMLPCDGRLLSISSYPDLFSLIGAKFGGDGRSTFGLPNLSSATSPVEGANYYMVVKGAMPVQ